MFDAAPRQRHDTPAAGQAAVTSTSSRGTVLVVDDELAVVRVYARALGAEGYHVLTATDGDAAELMFRKGAVDAVLSDITMPGMDGISLLRAMRRIDRDVPVILATGDHEEQSARRAVEEGALALLVKPVDLRALGQIVGHAVLLRRLGKLAREARDHIDAQSERPGERQSLITSFDAALEGLWIAFQPIVRWDTRAPVGFEALVRADESSLCQPSLLFGAAARLGRTLELGRAIRAKIAAAIPEAPEGARIFVNVDSEELQDEALYGAGEPLRPFADRVVLEIAERAPLDAVSRLGERIEQLRAAGFRIAVDDLGAGYAGLGSFARLRPSVVKLDVSLVRDIDQDAVKRKIVQSMATLCAGMRVELVAEGVETEQERQTLGFLGCYHHQGFLYAPPQRGFASSRGLKFPVAPPFPPT
jgi:EAL domain-containing protein (putative c-di-GMP-specific phosphodiesterase class I)